MGRRGTGSEGGAGWVAERGLRAKQQCETWIAVKTDASITEVTPSRRRKGSFKFQRHTTVHVCLGR